MSQKTNLETGQWAKNNSSPPWRSRWSIFGPTWTWNDTWMGHKSVPSIYSHCLGCVLAYYPVSRLIFSLNMASCHFGCFFYPKIPIFGPTWTWNDTWMGHKSVQHIYSHCLGCVLAHCPVSRWVIGLIWQPTIMVYFDPKMGIFERPLTWTGTWRGLNGLKPPCHTFKQAIGAFPV